MVVNNDFALQNVHNIRVVPDGLHRQFCSTNNQSVDVVVCKAVLSNQWTMIVRKLSRRAQRISPIGHTHIQRPGAATRISHYVRHHGIGIDVNDRPDVVGEHVVHDDRLNLTQKDSGCRVCSTGIAIVRCVAISVEFQNTVGNSQCGKVLSFNGVELAQAAGDGRRTAPICDDRIVDAATGHHVKHKPRPVTR